MSGRPRILDRYRNSESFGKPAVFKGTRGWIIVGPGLPWLGVDSDTYEEALAVALAHVGGRSKK